MKISDYFDNKDGFGVLSTSNAAGEVNCAVFSKPHVEDEATVAFITREHLTYSNLQENPSAAYLFRENGGGYKGVRLYLSLLRESSDQELMQSMKRRHLSPEEDKELGPKHIVYFSVKKIVPLIGSDPANVPF